MSGTILFRPVEANLTHDTNWLGKMDPYCKFSIGANHAQSSVCRHGGTRPHWGDTVSLNTTGLATGVANVVRLEIFDKDKFRPDDHIAYTDIDLAELLQLGSVSKWYPLYHRRKPAGEILIEAAIQQQQTFVQQTVVPTTYVQETVISTPLQGVVGESYVVSENVLQTGLPLNQNLGLVGSTNLGSYTVEPNVYTTSSVVTNPGLVASNPVVADPHLASKTSLLGPAGGIPHGFHKLKGMTNAGYSERPGYTLGDTEANPTCQSNLDSNGGGFFNKPGREKRAEPYSLSNPGTYGIPHGQTIDTAGHLRPDVTLERQAPIGTVNHPGITGYVDGYNVPQQGLYNSGLNSGVGTGLNQAGSYGTGLNTGLNQAGSYGTGLNTGLNQAGSYGTGLNTGLGTGLNQAGSYGTGLNTGLNQAGSYGTGLNTGLGQGSYVGGESNLVQGNLIGTLGQQNLGQYGQGLAQPGLNTQAGLSTQSGLVGQPGLTSQQGFAQTGVIDERGPTNTHYHGNTRL